MTATAVLDRRINNFFTGLRTRLHQGARDYGDTSFERPTDELVGEIEQELLDVAGWAFVAWEKLERAKNEPAPAAPPPQVTDQTVVDALLDMVTVCAGAEGAGWYITGGLGQHNRAVRLLETLGRVKTRPQDQDLCISFRPVAQESGTHMNHSGRPGGE